MPATRTAQQRAEERAARVKRIVDMRRLRMTFAEIGRREEISEQRAWMIYKQALRAIPAASLAEHRTEECTLIDDAIRNLLPLAMDRSKPRTAVEAWNGIARWAERKAKLLGLDAPLRVEVSDAVDAEIARLAAELGTLEPSGEATPAGDAAPSQVPAPTA